jgi:hypothetical protein
VFGEAALVGGLFHSNFNGDGSSDILWRDSSGAHLSTGQEAAALRDFNPAYVGSGSLPEPLVSAGTSALASCGHLAHESSPLVKLAHGRVRLFGHRVGRRDCRPGRRSGQRRHGGGKGDSCRGGFRGDPHPGGRPSNALYGIAEWLVKRLTEDRPTLVGIDHGFSFHRRDS